MTADEIKNSVEDSLSEKGWLKEVAYHLAMMNEPNMVVRGVYTEPEPKRKRKA